MLFLSCGAIISSCCFVVYSSSAVLSLLPVSPAPAANLLDPG